MVLQFTYIIADMCFFCSQMCCCSTPVEFSLPTKAACDSYQCLFGYSGFKYLPSSFTQESVGAVASASCLNYNSMCRLALSPAVAFI